MARGVKTGGRKPGSLNKRTVEVEDRLRELGCDPIEGMALLAMDMENTAELRGRMYTELAQYTAPKRKAVELTGAGGAPLQAVPVINVSVSGPK